MTGILSGKIWGKTECIVMNQFCEMHRIEVKSGMRCSTHLHKFKVNGFYVESGILEIHAIKNDYNLTDITVLNAGEYTEIQPNEKHFFVAKTDVIAIEIYFPKGIGDDIMRDNVGGKD